MRRIILAALLITAFTGCKKTPEPQPPVEPTPEAPVAPEAPVTPPTDPVAPVPPESAVVNDTGEVIVQP